jgi:hypothetical protein
MPSLVTLLYMLAAFGTGLFLLSLDWRLGALMAKRFTFVDVIVLAVLWPLTLALWFGPQD